MAASDEPSADLLFLAPVNKEYSVSLKIEGPVSAKVMIARLNVNIDHVATVRQARRTTEPSVVAAAMICEQAGADGITIHLRGDRRHIQDRDLYILRQAVTTYLNVEMAATEEMIKIACDARPDAVTLVAERPGEITTEGGLDARANLDAVRASVSALRERGIIASVFIDPEEDQIEAACDAGADQVELCTAAYAEATMLPAGAHPTNEERIARELDRLRKAAAFAARRKLRVAAGHGLTYRNIGAIAAIREIAEFNIGHNIIARAVLVGLERAVRDMLAAIREGAERT
ncbi:pyridoxine 5'-phosphate synthase [Pyrinomonas methylaliphatogenes]|uniref:Pyridoxine 5'-phosphate synthase n=1 Tax=Pyrinomonas methylaliphatogenes TaxID=454194 RepID=A0A0B6X0N5_9BACT|nr:pyridoxine 5'-phosphate synthase [Pyrinomonas methylaliphatogenes]